MSFTVKQQIFVAQRYYETKSYKAVSEDLENEFIDISPPNKSTISRIVH